MANTWICVHCGASFSDASTRERKYCSQRCLGDKRKALNDPNYMARAAARLWSRVNVRSGSECWEWRGATVKGYGRLRLNGKDYYAHRLAWELSAGESLGDRFACHTCDNPVCCNPAHIYAGNNQTNTADKVARGRAASRPMAGVLNSNAKLSPELVAAIRVSRGHATQRQLAEMFGVNRSHVHRIQHNQAWSHLAEEAEANASTRSAWGMA